MKYKNLRLIQIIGVLIIISLSSCNIKSNAQDTLSILFDTPEAIFAFELYTTLFPKKNITPIQFSNYSEISEADIIILNDTTIDTAPFSLSSTITNINNDTIHLHHTKQNMQLLSFSLPLLIVKRNFLHNTSPNHNRISLTQLQTLVKDTTALSTRQFSTFGFVPDMNKDFKKLFTSEKTYSLWIDSTYQNYADFNALFHKNFDAVPFIAQLRNDNIIYKLVSSNFFFNLPLETQNEFYYFFLTQNNEKIPAISKTYIGANKNSNTQKEIKHFIYWLYLYESQIAILNKQKIFYSTKDTLKFFSNTLSSNWDTNMSIFSNHSWLWNNQPFLQQIIFLE